MIRDGDGSVIVSATPPGRRASAFVATLERGSQNPGEVGIPPLLPRWSVGPTTREGPGLRSTRMGALAILSLGRSLADHDGVKATLWPCMITTRCSFRTDFRYFR